MRKTIAIALIATILALAGCSEPSGPGATDGSYEVIHVDIDGRSVPCVVWDGYNTGGITCNWGGSR